MQDRNPWVDFPKSRHRCPIVWSLHEVARNLHSSLAMVLVTPPHRIARPKKAPIVHSFQLRMAISTTLTVLMAVAASTIMTGLPGLSSVSNSSNYRRLPRLLTSGNASIRRGSLYTSNSMRALEGRGIAKLGFDSGKVK